MVKPARPFPRGQTVLRNLLFEIAKKDSQFGGKSPSNAAAFLALVKKRCGRPRGARHRQGWPRIDTRAIGLGPIHIRNARLGLQNSQNCSHEMVEMQKNHT
jgi:hypothetical protein